MGFWKPNDLCESLARKQYFFNSLLAFRHQMRNSTVQMLTSNSAQAWPSPPNLMICTCLMCLLNAIQPVAGASLVAPEWKAHFKGQFVIENCVFRETSFSWSTTNLYHAKYQPNAFLIREITALEDARQDHIDARNTYVGKFRSNYWAIEGGRVLKLFPNAEDSIKEFRNPEVSLIEAPRRKLIGALFYGFYLLDPASVKWVDELTFTGASFRGHKFRGIIRSMEGGLPTRIEWHGQADPTMQFTTECEYLHQLELPYYPSHILVRGTLNGQTAPVLEYSLLSLKLSQMPLAEDAFQPERYFSPVPPSIGQVLLVTNKELYFRDSSGTWQRVVSGPPPPLVTDAAGKQALTRGILYSLVGASILFLFFAFRRATRETTTPRK